MSPGSRGQDAEDKLTAPKGALAPLKGRPKDSQSSLGNLPSLSGGFGGTRGMGGGGGDALDSLMGGGDSGDAGGDALDSMLSGGGKREKVRPSTLKALDTEDSDEARPKRRGLSPVPERSTEGSLAPDEEDGALAPSPGAHHSKMSPKQSPTSQLEHSTASMGGLEDSRASGFEISTCDISVDDSLELDKCDFVEDVTPAQRTNGDDASELPSDDALGAALSQTGRTAAAAAARGVGISGAAGAASNKPTANPVASRAQVSSPQGSSKSPTASSLKSPTARSQSASLARKDDADESGEGYEDEAFDGESVAESIDAAASGDEDASGSGPWGSRSGSA